MRKSGKYVAQIGNVGEFEGGWLRSDICLVPKPPADAKGAAWMSDLSTNLKPQLIKISEAAELLRVSTSTIHNWIQAGSIPYIRLPDAGRRKRAARLLRGA